MALPRADATPANDSDARLAADAARGQPDALASLYSRYAKQLLATAYRLLQSKADAEDVVHDVFVGLPEALRRSYQERGALGGWLRTVTARVALMRLREQTARPHVPLTHEHPSAANSRDASLTIEHALQALSPNLRAVLVLKEIEGFSHAEIAEMLDISVGASEVRLHRALSALRAMLLQDDTR